MSYLVAFWALIHGMVTLMAIQEGAPRALRLAQRMDHLGLPGNVLAKMANVDSESVARARAGNARAATYGKLERALDAFEHETGADEPDESVTVIEMADGTRVTHRGVSAQDAARFAAEFLARNRAGSA